MFFIWIANAVSLFQLLESIRTEMAGGNCSTALREENSNKNRSDQFLPGRSNGFIAVASLSKYYPIHH